MFGLGHLDFGPLAYGIVMFMGIASMYLKLVNGRIVDLITEVGIFSLVFWLHGGTMAGGFAAMVCALLAGFIFPIYRRKHAR
jgi:hypothetical protein